MTKEELIEELKKIKEDRCDQLAKLNITHDNLLFYIAELNNLIEEAEKESDE